MLHQKLRRQTFVVFFLYPYLKNKWHLWSAYFMARKLNRKKSFWDSLSPESKERMKIVEKGSKRLAEKERIGGEEE